MEVAPGSEYSSVFEVFFEVTCSVNRCLLSYIVSSEGINGSGVKMAIDAHRAATRDDDFAEFGAGLDCPNLTFMEIVTKSAHGYAKSSFSEHLSRQVQSAIPFNDLETKYFTL